MKTYLHALFYMIDKKFNVTLIGFTFVRVLLCTFKRILPNIYNIFLNKTEINLLLESK